jgi:predicted acylesterase/phospholipase RssA
MNNSSQGQIEGIDRIKQEVKDLKAGFKFNTARKKIEIYCRSHPDNVWLKQQLAFCTYKDDEVFPVKRFEAALEILESIGLRDPGLTDAETLSLGGAVYKRWWEYGGQLENLYLALTFYRAAWKRNPRQDMGYGGINAAYILQLLASRARAAANRSKTDSPEANMFISQADALRRDIIVFLNHQLEKKPSLDEENWFLVTRAEAHFGLGEYDKAAALLEKTKPLDVSEWERQTTFRQLVSIARLQDVELPDENEEPDKWDEAWKALQHMLGDDIRSALSCYRGKVGLALSGGGFRASLYHLGVLARLAEMDVLRSVEVLSTVSGGSIVGAHYYLEVKHLLETKADADITRQDYIDIVRRVQHDFLEGVQQNIRTLAFGDFKKNVSMIFSKSYSRSHRLGELYEEVLYSRVKDGHPKGQPRRMTDLLITPKAENPDFDPTFSNWRRNAKVPALLLNATTLNSGHNWRFTAKSLGEPPGLLGSEVDKNTRYRRLWYKQAPQEAIQSYRLGYAVAASACVPGLFEPLELEGLYPDKVIRLVDGGVHDNQGVQGLLDSGCTFVFCSDASGQMGDEEKPKDSIPSVMLRSNAIMMDRVREAEYQDLLARLDARALQGLLFVHLKKDLPAHPEDWVHCQDPSPSNRPSEIPYGIDPEIQSLIAGIRTDLDSFTEVEAYSLMLSGYLMTEQECTAIQKIHEKSGEPGKWGGFKVDEDRGQWRFLELEQALAPGPNDTDARDDLELQLSAASSIPLKIWKLDPGLKKKGGIIIAAGAAALLLLIYFNWHNPLFPSWLTVGGAVLMLMLFAATLTVPAVKWVKSGKALRGIAKNILIALVGSWVARIHLKRYDRKFLELGRLSRFLSKSS